MNGDFGTEWSASMTDRPSRETLLAALQAQTNDNRRQRACWAQLRAVVDERLAISRQVEPLRTAHGAEAANAHVASQPLVLTRARVLDVAEQGDWDWNLQTNDLRVSARWETMLGCEPGVSLDDFGTGYSSLTYLRKLPVHTLKLDQSFVRNMLADPEDLGIVRGVIQLARAFNRRVIAEGVETMAHGQALVGMGCCCAQGHGIGRPMPASALPAWRAEWLGAKTWLKP